MATQTITVPLQFPQSVPARKISQQELTGLIEARNTIAELEKYAKSLEGSLKSRLQSGAAVEPGVHVAEVNQHSRRSPAWKEVAASLARTLGFDPDEYCSNVITTTKPSVWFSLDIN
jgi:hypothetical protein